MPSPSDLAIDFSSNAPRDGHGPCREAGCGKARAISLTELAKIRTKRTNPDGGGGASACALIPLADPIVTYRSDIDGLRALSVLAVIAFHLNGFVPGGYVGVDVFFVISGFVMAIRPSVCLVVALRFVLFSRDAPSELSHCTGR